jgi:hypothetical protein
MVGGNMNTFVCDYLCGVLRRGFHSCAFGALGLVAMTAACGPTEPAEAGSLGSTEDPSDPTAESPLAIKGPPKELRGLGPSPAAPREPLECSEILESTQCKRYSIQLLGNPHTDPVLRANYIAEFGRACYLSAGGTFGCFYKKAQVKPYGDACKHAQMVAKVYGAQLQYEDHPLTCKAVPGTNEEQYTLQVGPDSVHVVHIDLLYAPLETSDIDVNGVPTAINGPYRNLPEPPKVKVGGRFDCASGQVGPDGKPMQQRKWILEVNKKAHGGVIHSDLAGFTWPCEDDMGDPTTCTEEDELLEKSTDLAKAAQVHHEVRRKDLRGCKWGTNSNKNAVVISAKLNNYLSNKYPTKEEVDWVNKLAPYTP